MQGVLSDIRGLESPPKIVVLSIKPEDQEPAFSAGADAFSSKNAPPEKLLEVILSLR